MAREPQVPLRPACQLYLITPSSIDDLDAFAARLDAALGAGEVACVQIRLKPASDDQIREAVAKLKPVCHAHGVPVLLNDRPDLARATGCDGVHVGQEDASVADARRMLGENGMIGATCHDSRHLAMEASEASADYVAFGAFFPTDTKETTHRPELEILTIWQETMETPCVAIGGITVETAAEVARAGADFIAVSGGVWNHPEGEVVAIKAFCESLATAF
ncbi:thiamine-phosphate pyrophosphorylase [Brevundimonas sp. GN22]|uniref:thiamine phosphate synthase n=1 Tax=Brevundimonas pishanensis TaxID=2896315 RepID=UPI001FA78F76|nr:thiamine phosphate synthase [Brevundimonas pishanensis]